MNYLFKFNQIRAAHKESNEINYIDLQSGSPYQTDLINTPSSSDRKLKIKRKAEVFANSDTFLKNFYTIKTCQQLLNIYKLLQEAEDPIVKSNLENSISVYLEQDYRLFIEFLAVRTVITNLKDSILTIKLLPSLHKNPIQQMTDCLKAFDVLVRLSKEPNYPNSQNELAFDLKKVLRIVNGVLSPIPAVKRENKPNTLKDRLEKLALNYKLISKAIQDLSGLSPKDFIVTKQKKSAAESLPKELQPTSLFLSEWNIRNEIFKSVIKSGATTIVNGTDGQGKISGAIASLQNAKEATALNTVYTEQPHLNVSSAGKLALTGKNSFIPDLEGTSLKLIPESIKKIPEATLAEIKKYNLDLNDPINISVEKLLEEKKNIFEEAQSLMSPITMNQVRRIGSTVVHLYSMPNAKLFSWGPDTLLDQYNHLPFTIDQSVPTTHATFEPAGAIELHIVKQQLKKYELGEISHIENILKGESKDRIFRTRLETETITTRETEKETSTENSLETTDRFEMQREAKEALTEQTDIKGSLSIEGSYGPSFKFQASGEAGWNRRSEQSSSFASTVAREVTQKATEKVTERILNRETRRILREIEDTNHHSFDNKQGDNHVTGMYQWLTKIYEAQVFNYGFRTIYDLMIPEPAALLLDSFQKRRSQALELVQPPAFEIKPIDLNEFNYQRFITLYGATDIIPPPQPYRTESYNFNTGGAEKDQKFTNSTKIQIPDGYEAFHASFGVVVMVWDGWVIDVILGQRSHRFEEGNGWVWFTDLNRETGSVPMALTTHRISDGALAIEVQCRRTERAIQLWQADTHAKLLEAYRARMSEYEAKLAELEVNAPQKIESGSSAANLATINEEIKRACISVLTRQNYDLFDAINNDSHGLPVIDFTEAEEEGKYVRFFEQAFEWENISFITYPYFWGRKSNWLDKLSIKDDDFQFEAFLKAGYIRVILPIRRGFEAAVDHFRLFGEPWVGGPLPTVSDDLYLPLADELAERLDRPGDEVPIGNAWEFSIPTSLVKLRKDASLPEWKKQADGSWHPVGE